MHRVLCCGGRDYQNVTHVRHCLEYFHSLVGDFAVIHGAARGADILCGNWAISEGLPVIEVNANWMKHGKGAGPIRNQWMIDLCFPTYAIAFPGGNGTADMIARLTKANIPVWRVS